MFPHFRGTTAQVVNDLDHKQLLFAIFRQGLGPDRVEQGLEK